MGVINIRTSGSFPTRHRVFSAVEHGHAHAVAQAIEFLTKEVLPEAIERDHNLHESSVYPLKGFEKP